MNVDLNTILSESESDHHCHRYQDTMKRSVMKGESQTTGHCVVSGMRRSYALWSGQISTGEVTA